jgi:bifunctional ADP-heptose synthase (sugar kinase/adenylyltransferase)
MSELPKIIHETPAQAPRFEVYNKIVTPVQAIKQTRDWQRQGLKVAVTDVVCDIPQHLHKEYLATIASLSNKLVVRVDTDKHAKEKKGHPKLPPELDKPYNTLEYRQKDLAHLPYVDLITEKAHGSLNWISIFKPDIIIKSTTSGQKLIAEIKELQELIVVLGQPTQIIILDENCDVVDHSEALDKAIEYDNNKYDKKHHSGSTITKKIEDRFMALNQDNLKCDIPPKYIDW